ncbi:MAG: alpha/beta hydrolase [Gemmataceae bacterium]|nr:alpha/beta hydrolase [Gemmataceae bacterium]MCI0741373.1 alpha/beta hydrolase [Gemmataceae bacterium]
MGTRFRAAGGTVGCAQLTNYTAQYCEWGSGPPVVLVPGLAGGFELLGPLAASLARDFRVISYQLRGEDNCFALRRPFNLNDLVDDLAEFLRWLRLEKPTVFGVSFGGVLALEFAARFPHQLKELVLQGVGARFEKSLLQLIAGTVLSRFPLPHDSQFVNQFFNLLFGRPQKSEELVDFVTRQIWQTDQSVMAHRFQMVRRYHMHHRFDKIRVPTLILSGDRDILVSRRRLQELRQGIAQAQGVDLPGCGHLAFATHPELIARQVRKFLAA